MSQYSMKTTDANKKVSTHRRSGAAQRHSTRQVGSDDSELFIDQLIQTEIEIYLQSETGSPQVQQSPQVTSDLCPALLLVLI